MDSEFPQNPDPGLAGSLLLADPSLRESTFFRTVLVLSDHQKAAGARGYVVNRPLDQKVGDFLGSKEFAEVWQVPVFSGGPVSRNELMFISIAWDSLEKRLHWSDPLGLEGAKKAVAGGGHVRAFLGYSGWAPKQLESEIERKSWICHPASPEVLEGTADENLWSRLLNGMGPFYQMLAAMPADPGLN